MKKRFLFPLIGIAVFGVSGIITGTALALTAPNFLKDLKQDYLKLALYNLDNPDILNNFDNLRNYLLDYNVIDLYNYNNLTDINVSVNNDNDSKYYFYDFQFNFADSTKKIINNVETRILKGNNIDNLIDFNNIIRLFNSASEITTLYNLFYNSSGSQIVNYLVNNCGFNEEMIDYAILNITNSFNNTVANTIKFKLKIHLNDGYFYNGNQYISIDLYSNCIIDWSTYSKNATKYFTFSEPGVITGLTKLGMQQELLIIPSTYIDKYGETQPITSINNLASNIDLLMNDGDQNPIIGAKTIIMSNSITSIGNNFLYSDLYSSSQLFPSLKWINISSSISSIGDNAFKNVASIDNIDFENCDTLISIGANAFNSTYMHELTIPNSVVFLSEYSFANLNNGTKEGTTYKLNLRLSRSLKNIPEFCFYNSGINDNLVLPNGIVQINKSAFENSNIQRINIPYTISSIGNFCFKNSKFENIVFPEHDELNAINFGRNSFELIKANVFILGKYNSLTKLFNSTSIDNNSYIYFNDQETYSYYLSTNYRININNVILLNRNGTVDLNLDYINEFMHNVNKDINNIQDLSWIFSNCTNYFKQNINQKFLLNNDWIKFVDISINSNDNIINELIFNIYLSPNFCFKINIPILDKNIKLEINYSNSSNTFNQQLLNTLYLYIQNISYNIDIKNNTFKNSLTFNSFYDLYISKINKIIKFFNVNIEFIDFNLWGANASWHINEEISTDNYLFNLGLQFNTNDFNIQNENFNNIYISSYKNVKYIIIDDLISNLKI